MDSKKQRHIVVTGSQGLIGTALVAALRNNGHSVVGMDIRASAETGERGDIKSETDIIARVEGCVGVVHLAALSRVAIAHKQPELCMATNYEATKLLADRAKEAGADWFIYASSREVYGHVTALPATEQTPLNPVNVYGRSKLQSEEHIQCLSSSTFNTSILRFSNVFGAANDHATRVVPAFIQAAAAHRNMYIEGGQNTFDFTFLDEVVRGILATVSAVESGQALLPMHFCTGRGTTLDQLSRKAVDLFSSQSRCHSATPRDFDVSAFYGDSTRALQQIGWVHRSDSLNQWLRTYAERLGLIPTPQRHTEGCDTLTASLH